MWSKAAARITEAWKREGKLPFKPKDRLYHYTAIGSIVWKSRTSPVQFSTFYYTNEDHGGADSDYGYSYGPDIKLKEIWSYLSDNEKTCIMAETLGSKNND